MRFFRRKETPWEVVGSKYVDSVPMYDEDEVLDVARVSRTDTSIKFMHDIYEMKDVRRVVQTARLLLMQRIQQERYNTLLSEGWQITVYRKGNKHRVEVTYTGRAAYITTKPKTRSAPPFIDILEFYRRDMCTM